LDAFTNVAGSVVLINHSLRISTAGASICAAAGGLALFFASYPATRAADAGKEIATAAQHAGYAADSTAIGMAHAHLQHTINCLVGPQGWFRLQAAQCLQGLWQRGHSRYR
jgi:hypothetical protein